LQSRQFIDFSNFKYEDTVRSTKLRSQFGNEVEKLAVAIASAINQKDVTKKTKSSKKKKSNSTENMEELLQLAKEYEEIRKKLPSSDNRTRVMENIVSKMKAAMDEPIGELPKLMKSKSAGERLLAIAKLQKFPNLEYLNWLAEHVGDSEKPFVGYHASVALYIASRAFGKDNKKQLEKVLNAAMANIKKHQFQDPNQVDVISSALNELQIK
jgi:hypothetical protein